MTLYGALTAAGGSPGLFVVSDYDGVLSPIVNDPASAYPDGRAVDAMRRLASHPKVTCAIVSGRSPEVLAGFLGQADGIDLIGNHGAVTSPADRARVEAVVDELEALAKTHPGAHVEAKSAGAAFHVRHTDDPDRAAASARDLAASHGARTIEGKAVVELTFGEGDKGTAVMALRHGSNGPMVFLGDDVTDEAVFEVLGDHDVGIKVGPGPTVARYRITGQSDVAPLLERLISVVPRPG